MKKMTFIKHPFSFLHGKMRMTSTMLIFVTSFFFVLFDNFTFFQHVLQVYPFSLNNIGFLTSLAVGLTAFIMFLLTLVSSRYTTKPVLISFLMLSAVAAYFMDNYQVVIDHIMIQNMVQTDLAEMFDLLSLKLLYYCFLLGVLPGFFICRIAIEPAPWKRTVLRKTRDIILTVLVVLGLILIFSKFYTSFFREHKPLRYYTNPIYYIYSVGKYINRTFDNSELVVTPLGTDAKVVERDENENDDHNELVILVIGEAARADHFSLNGYYKETNPLLKQENIINFTNMYSSGTSTAFSVPCMFSICDRKKYTNKKGITNENVLDVLKHTKNIEILWRDNNSDSKGVALRVSYENFHLLFETSEHPL